MLGIGIVSGFFSVVLFLLIRNTENVITYYFTPFLLDAVTETKEITYTLFDILRIWGIVVTETIAAQAGAVFVLLLCFCVGVVHKYFPQASRTTTLLLPAMIFLAFLMHTGTILYYGTYHPDVFWIIAVSTILLVAIVVFSRADELLVIHGAHRGVVLIGAWIGAHVLVYSFFLPGYSRELLPPFVLAASFAGDALWSSWRINKTQGALVVLACVGLWYGGALWYQNPRVGGWWWSQETMNNVATYVREHTSPDERIFTANPLPAVLAHRRTVMDMNPYAIKLADGPDSAWGSFASPNAYYRELVLHPPRYAIVDGRMESQYFASYPMFQEFVNTNYHPVETFWTGERRGRTVVWERNAE